MPPMTARTDLPSSFLHALPEPLFQAAACLPVVRSIGSPMTGYEQNKNKNKVRHGRSDPDQSNQPASCADNASLVLFQCSRRSARPGSHNLRLLKQRPRIPRGQAPFFSPLPLFSHQSTMRCFCSQNLPQPATGSFHTMPTEQTNSPSNTPMPSNNAANSIVGRKW